MWVRAMTAAIVLLALTQVVQGDEDLQLDNNNLILLNVAVKGELVQLLANELARTEIIRALLVEYAKECVQNVTILERECRRCIKSRCKDRLQTCGIPSEALKGLFKDETGKPEIIPGVQFLKSPPEIQESVQTFATRAKKDIMHGVPESLIPEGQTIMSLGIEGSLQELQEAVTAPESSPKEDTMKKLEDAVKMTSAHLEHLPEVSDHVATKLGNMVVDNEDTAVNIAEKLAVKLREARPLMEHVQVKSQSMLQQLPSVIQRVGQKVEVFKKNIQDVFGKALGKFNSVLNGPTVQQPMNAGMGLSSQQLQMNTGMGMSQQQLPMNAGMGMSQQQLQMNAGMGMSQQQLPMNAGMGMSPQQLPMNTRIGMPQQQLRMNAGMGMPQQQSPMNTGMGMSQQQMLMNTGMGMSQQQLPINAGIGMSPPQRPISTGMGLSPQQLQTNTGMGLSPQQQAINPSMGMPIRNQQAVANANVPVSASQVNPSLMGGLNKQGPVPSQAPVQRRFRRYTEPSCKDLKTNVGKFCDVYHNGCFNCTQERRLRSEVCGVNVEKARDEIKRLDMTVVGYLEAYDQYVGDKPMVVKVMMNEAHRLLGRKNAYGNPLVTAKVGNSIVTYESQAIIDQNNLVKSGVEIAEEIWMKLWDNDVFAEAELLTLATSATQEDQTVLHTQVANPHAAHTVESSSQESSGQSVPSGAAVHLTNIIYTGLLGLFIMCL